MMRERDLPPRGGRQLGPGSKGHGKGFGGRGREYSSSWGRGEADERGHTAAKSHKIDPEDQGNLPEQLIPLSRTLARMLRHGRDVALDKDGWASLSDVLSCYDMKDFHRDDINIVVKESYSKNVRRFELEERGSKAWIRAAHKRSINYEDVLGRSYHDDNGWHDNQSTPPSRRYDALKDMHPDVDGCETPPPPDRQEREDPPGLELDEIKLPATPPRLAEASNGHSSPGEQASDPWQGAKGGRGAVDPWAKRAQVYETVAATVQKRKTVGFREPAPASPSSPSFVGDLMDLDPVGIEADKEIDTRAALMEVFIGDMEEEDGAAAAATAAVYEIEHLEEGSEKKDADPQAESPQAEAESPQAEAESDVGRSNVPGNIWEHYDHEDPSKGTWWWCEKTRKVFLECEPGPWSQYEDPVSKRPYWHNAETEEFFFAA